MTKISLTKLNFLLGAKMAGLLLGADALVQPDQHAGAEDRQGPDGVVLDRDYGFGLEVFDLGFEEAVARTLGMERGMG